MNKKFDKYPRTVAVYFITFLCFACACKKLPKETHKGKGMMACYVNGEKWEAKDKKFTFDLSTIGTGASNEPNPSAIIFNAGSSQNWLSTSGMSLILSGGSKKEDQGGITIYIINFIGIGDYELNYSHKPASYADYSGSPFGDMGTDSLNNGKIEIKYYTDIVIAGTFSFKARNKNGTVINFTEGRFDVEYSTK